MREPEDILRRVPPQDLGAEQAVLGAILFKGISTRSDGEPGSLFAEQSRVLAAATSIIGPADFYREAHREIFRAMLDLHDDNTTIDARTLGAVLRDRKKLEAIGGEAYVVEVLGNTPSAENIAHYARIVREKSALRDLAAAATAIAADAYDTPPEVAEFLAQAEARLMSATRADLGVPAIPFATAVEEVIAAACRGELAGVKTGFPVLDQNLTAGGFARGDLIVLAATTSAGKTSLAANVALRETRGGVLFISLEMSRDQMIRRFLADLGLIDWAAISQRRPALPTREERARMNAAAENLAAIPIDVIRPRRLTPAGVRREARIVLPKFDGKLDLIVVDYLQIMGADESHKRRDLEIGSITRELKQIAVELDAPVLLLSQLNREGAKRPGDDDADAGPELWHLRDSGSIEQDGDVVIFLWTKATRFDRKYFWKIAKQRNGKKVDLGSIEFEAEYTRFLSEPGRPFNQSRE
jgi:replicative DNA helicase